MRKRIWIMGVRVAVGVRMTLLELAGPCTSFIRTPELKDTQTRDKQIDFV